MRPNNIPHKRCRSVIVLTRDTSDEAYMHTKTCTQKLNLVDLKKAIGFCSGTNESAHFGRGCIPSERWVSHLGSTFRNVPADRRFVSSGVFNQLAALPAASLPEKVRCDQLSMFRSRLNGSVCCVGPTQKTGNFSFVLNVAARMLMGTSAYTRVLPEMILKNMHYCLLLVFHVGFKPLWIP